MRIKLAQPLILGTILIFGATDLAAKSEAANGGNYTTKDQEFYLTSDEIFFIRPGLEIEILDAVIPADRQLEVTYSLKDPGGLPLDIEGIYTPGPVDMRYMLTHIPFNEEQKVKDTEGSRDADGALEPLGDGVYKYKFGTILPESYDPDVTYTLALVGRRDLREWDLDRYVDNELHHFVPSSLSDPAPRDVVTTETCNSRCHDPLAMHGGRYQEVHVCTQCHNPGLFARDGSGDSRSFDLLIHQVHAGPNLETPLVIGRHDYSKMEYPAEINECEVCHTGGIPTENFPLVASPATALVCDRSGSGEITLTWQHSAGVEIQVRSVNDPDGKLFARGGKTGSVSTGKWVKDGTVFDLYDIDSMELLQSVPVNATVLGCVSNAPGTFRGLPGIQHPNRLDHPSRMTCGSCHDYIDFETGEGHSDFDIIQVDDTMCANCHVPDSGNEFDRSIRGAHLEFYKSAQLPGVVVEFMDVTNTNPGDTPTVTFTLGGKNGPIHPASLDRLRFVVTGPNDDYSFYVSETVGGAAVKEGDYWSYTFNTALPLDAEGSFTVSMEGRNMVEVDLGNEISTERDSAENPSFAFAVTDANAVPRRMVVDDAKCESCHVNLLFHGGNRHDPQYCDTCHRPDLLDLTEPLQENVSFKWMIHKIHRGAELENGYVVVRSRGRTYDFGHVEFPGDLRNCDKCHVNDSQQLPLPEGLLPTLTPAQWWDPTMPMAAACLSCHDGDDAAAHAYANTTFFGESCATCHGEDKEFAVDKVHAH